MGYIFGSTRNLKSCLRLGRHRSFALVNLSKLRRSPKFRWLWEVAGGERKGILREAFGVAADGFSGLEGVVVVVVRLTVDQETSV